VPATVSAQLLDCLIQPNQVLQVGAAVSGVIEAIDVERGDAVRRGQVVARLAADVERASADLAQARAGQTAELQAAERSREFARREMARARELVAENFVSRAAVDKAETESQVSEDRHRQSVERRRQAELEQRLAEAQLARRQVRAPISGIVTDRFMGVGEFVEDKPILRIVEVNPLRVEVLVPAPAFGLIAAGTRATIRPEVGPVREAVATVTIVDRVLDPASNTFRVRLALPNPDLRVPAGARCKVDFGLDASAFAPTPAAPAARTRPGAAPVAPVAPVAPASAPAPGPTIRIAPVSQAPTLPEPAQPAPVSQAPVSRAPVSQAPVSRAPVSQAPVMQAPGAPRPSPVAAHVPAR
jgi:membrane fusion protein, heavy metal efflux system